MTKEEIFDVYYERIVSFMYRKVSDHYLAEDLASEVMMKVYDKLQDYDETKASVSTWIYTIANNRVIDFYRTNHITEDIADREFADAFSMDDEIIAKENLSELANALRKLPEREMDLIVLHYYDGMSLKKVSEKMGISYSYIKILHNKALKSMKNLLGV